jgi:hypothetical protein
MSFAPPEGLTAEDEGRHPCPKHASSNVLFGDSLWVSVVDPEANIHGVNHFHLTNKGFARYEALYVIDGVLQQYGNKFPLPLDVEHGPWDDGRMRYEVVDPYNHIRISLDWDRFSFDLDFKGRFAPFNYANSHPNGDPMRVFDEYYGGHFEQAMNCTGRFEIYGGRAKGESTGRFEIYGGRAKGETRQIDCWSHRDHTWTSRFNEPNRWVVQEGHFPAHFWPSIQLPDRHINVLGMYYQNDTPIEERVNAGFVSDKDGSRPIRNARGLISPNDGTAGVRTAKDFWYEIELDDGELIHVKSTKHHGTIKLWMRAENDLENRLDCYEAFCDFEVEETGEVGTGTAEYDVMPPLPQWLV